MKTIYLLSLCILLGFIYVASATSKLVSSVKYFEGVSISIPPLVIGKKRMNNVRLSFSAHNRKFDLELEPFTELFAPNAFHEIYENGKVIPKEFDQGIYYKGRVIGDPAPYSYSVVLTLEPESNLVTGFIHTHNESYSLESSTRYFNKRTPYDVVMYNWADVEMPPNFCGVDEHQNGHSPQTRSMVENIQHYAAERGPALSRACQVSLVGNSYWYQNGWGSSYFTSVREMVNSMVGSNTIYRRDIGSGFQILSTRIYTDPASDPFRTAASSSINTFLTTLDSTKGSIPPAAGRCLIHAYTYNDYSGTIGLAYVGVLCRTSGGAGVTTGNSFGSPLSSVALALTVAHEIGHNHNAGHDPSSSCTDPVANRQFVMAACNGGANTLIPFSATSISTINAAVNAATCFGTYSLDRCGNGAVEDVEQCDCGELCASDSWCDGPTCTLKNGAQCSTSAGECCDGATGRFKASGTACGTSPYSFIPAPACSGTSANCTKCYFGHPCDKYSNTKPCLNTANPCASSCVFTGGDTTCYPASQISGIDPNLPDGTCCTTTTGQRGTCRSGTCTATQTCVPTTCSALGKNCGSWPNGCGGTLSCGTCATTCNNGVCCVPATCASLGKTCGSWSDGCGNTLNCGACAGGVPCPTNGVCPACTPATCTSLGKNCGSWSNGCGGTLSCGTCANGYPCNNGVCCTPTITSPCAGLTCSTAFDGCVNVPCGTCTAPNVCNTNTKRCECVPNANACSGKQCGNVFDGCTTISCGTCPNGATCLTSGLCPCVPTSSCTSTSCSIIFDGCNNINCGNCTSPFICNTNTKQCECTPTTCTALGKNCDTWSNGCGGTLGCGTCGTGFSCLNGVCTVNTCTPTTSCAAQNRQCGTINDGCNTITCGSCTAPFTCVNGACSCTPTTSCNASNYECGILNDGCGRLLDCGNCPSQSNIICSTSGRCVCTPTTTCAQAGQSCDILFDGCKNVDCGTCQSPAVCSPTKQCRVSGCIPNATCLDSGRECGTLFDGCTDITCGVCSADKVCLTDGTCGVQVDVEVNQEVKTSNSKRGLWIGIGVAAGAFLLFVVIAIVVGVLYVRRRRENRKYERVETIELAPVYSAPSSPIITGSPSSAPLVTSSPTPSAPPRTMRPPPAQPGGNPNVRTLREPPPPPVKKLPPPPSRPLPQANNAPSAPGTLRPAPQNVPIPPRPVSPPASGAPNPRHTVKIPAPVVIPQARPRRDLPSPPGGRPNPQNATMNQGRPLPAPQPRNPQNATINQGRPLPAKQPRPKSVKRPMAPVNASHSIGQSVKAKYSQDGQFYDGIIDDIQHGFYLVRYPAYDNFQEWVAVADIK